MKFWDANAVRSFGMYMLGGCLKPLFNRRFTAYMRWDRSLSKPCELSRSHAHFWPQVDPKV